MGFLDDVLSGFGPAGGGSKLLRRNVKTGEKLLAEGELGTAQICGIRVRPGHDSSPDQQEFALAFAGTCVGCRQDVGALLPTMRLGMEVPIRHDGDEQAIIDLPALGGDADAWGYKPLGEPPADGIDDYRVRLDKERRRASHAALIVLGAQRSVVLGITAQNVNLRVRVEQPGVPPYEAAVERELVPFYAAHLVEPGSRVPGLVRDDQPGKVRIDWPAAAIADPGIGRPPAAVLMAHDPRTGARFGQAPQEAVKRR